VDLGAGAEDPAEATGEVTAPLADTINQHCPSSRAVR
jgi:hypothetical protein